MELRPAALRFVLEQGLPAMIVVSGRSMEPTIPLGARVDVAPLPAGASPAVGEIVLVATAAAEVLVLHRVMHVSADGDLVIHQGDAQGAAFATCARRDVLARMTGFAGEDAATRPLPLPENLSASARARFRRRRLACVAFARARAVARALSVEDHPLVRRCGVMLRKLARRLGG